MQILVLLGMYFGICHQPDTFIQIGSGHTVASYASNYYVANGVAKFLKNS